MTACISKADPGGGGAAAAFVIPCALALWSDARAVKVSRAPGPRPERPFLSRRRVTVESDADSRQIKMNVSNHRPQPLKRYNPTGFSASVDLVAASVKHLALLCAVDTFPRSEFVRTTPRSGSTGRPAAYACIRCAAGLYEGPYAEDAIRRYEKIWLPLYAAASSEERSGLVPPLDVAWVWHVHRLRPGAYIEYCKQAYGRELHVEAAAQAFSFTNGSGAPAPAQCRKALQKSSCKR
jgi:hypothetical protein